VTAGVTERRITMPKKFPEEFRRDVVAVARGTVRFFV
jgi:hypothetical protein